MMNLEWVIISKEEMENLRKFINTHKKCKIFWEEVAPTLYSLRTSYNTVGSLVIAKCEKCGKEEDISGKIRSNW